MSANPPITPVSQPYDTGFTSQVDSALATSLSAPKQTLADVRETLNEHIAECIANCKGVISECVSCINSTILTDIGAAATTLQALGSDINDAIINLLGTAYGYAATLGISMPPGYTVQPTQVINEVTRYGQSQPSTIGPTQGPQQQSTIPPPTPQGGYYLQPPAPTGTGFPPGNLRQGYPQTQAPTPPGMTPPSYPQTVPPSGGGISTVQTGTPQPSAGGGTSTPIPPGGTSTPPVYSPNQPATQGVPTPSTFQTGQVNYGAGNIPSPTIIGGSYPPLHPVYTTAAAAPFVGTAYPGGIPLPSTQFGGGGVQQGFGSVVNCPPPNITCPSPQVVFTCPPPVINVYVEPSGRTTTDIPPAGGVPRVPQPGEIGCPDRNEHEWIDQDCSIAFRQECINVMGFRAVAFDAAGGLDELCLRDQDKEFDIQWVPLAAWRRNSH